MTQQLCNDELSQTLADLCIVLDLVIKYPVDKKNNIEENLEIYWYSF